MQTRRSAAIRGFQARTGTIGKNGMFENGARLKSENMLVFAAFFGFPKSAKHNANTIYIWKK